MIAKAYEQFAGDKTLTSTWFCFEIPQVSGARYDKIVREHEYNTQQNKLNGSLIQYECQKKENMYAICITLTCTVLPYKNAISMEDCPRKDGSCFIEPIIEPIE